MKKKNVAGADRNGYIQSIVSPLERCYLCGRQTNLQRHEIFNAAYRQKSKRLGCWVWLCSDCHYDITFVHAERRINLKAVGQKSCMECYGISVDEFRKLFGKNYLEDG